MIIAIGDDHGIMKAKYPPEYFARTTITNL